MDGYELRDHHSQQRLRPIGGYFENFYSSVSRISEKIYSQQAVYLSYTLGQISALIAFGTYLPISAGLYTYTSSRARGKGI